MSDDVKLRLDYDLVIILYVIIGLSEQNNDKLSARMCVDDDHLIFISVQMLYTLYLLENYWLPIIDNNSNIEYFRDYYQVCKKTQIN